MAAIDITQHRHALLFIVLVVLIDAISFGIILPVMPQLIISLSDVSLSEASRIGGYLMFICAAVLSVLCLFIFILVVRRHGFSDLGKA